MTHRIERKEYTVRRPNRRQGHHTMQKFVTVKWDIYSGDRWVATYNLKRDAVNRLNRLTNQEGTT